MTPDQQTYLLIKGIVADLPEEDRKKVEAAVADIRQVIVKHGQVALLAVALVGAEVAKD